MSEIDRKFADSGWSLTLLLSADLHQGSSGSKRLSIRKDPI